MVMSAASCSPLATGSRVLDGHWGIKFGGPWADAGPLGRRKLVWGVRAVETEIGVQRSRRDACSHQGNARRSGGEDLSVSFYKTRFNFDHVFFWKLKMAPTPEPCFFRFDYFRNNGSNARKEIHVWKRRGGRAGAGARACNGSCGPRPPQVPLLCWVTGLGTGLQAACVLNQKLQNAGCAASFRIPSHFNLRVPRFSPQEDPGRGV
jgi:hypothetical protein